MSNKEKVSGEEVEVVATLILGGIFYGSCGHELCDNDIEPRGSVLDRLQSEIVDSADDVQLDLMTVAQHQRITDALLEDARYNYQLALDWQDKVIELQAQLAAAPAPVQAEPASPWVRVVDQQPKKGEDVLVWCHDTNEQFVAFSLGDGRFQFGIGQDGTILVCRPNYWQPLPKAPYQP